MKKEYVVDLTQRLIPNGEHNFEFTIDLRDADESINSAGYDEETWYKIAYVGMCTHNSTHVEVPFHHIKTGLTVADFPLEQMIGNLVVLDFTHKKEDDFISEEDLRAYDDLIHEGDIVFLKTHMDKYFRSEKWCTYPYVTVAGVEYLVSKKIGVLGTDAAGIENEDKSDPSTYNQPAHTALLSANIPLIESLTNLDAVENGKYMVFILPIPIEQGDACPVRVTAIDKKGLAEYL